jgi:hypothetical protein
MGEVRIDVLVRGLSTKAGIFRMMNKLADAKAAAEEAYTCVSEVHDPEHPLVLEAASTLIAILSNKGDH